MSFNSLGVVSSKRLLMAARAALVTTLVSGMLVPIYTDEVAWRIQLSRYFQDGYQDRNIGESCGINLAVSPPWSMVPFRIFSSAVTHIFSDPIWVRLAGIGCALSLLAMLAALICRIIPSPAGRVRAELFLLGMLGLGVLPYLLVWSRPEAPIYISLLATLIIAFSRKPESKGSERIIAAIAITLIAIAAQAYHVKAIIYIPIYLAALWASSSPGNRFPIRAVGGILILTTAGFAFHYWQKRFECPSDPLLAARSAKENLAFAFLHRDYTAIATTIGSRLYGVLPFRYMWNTVPVARHMSHWLPDLPSRWLAWSWSLPLLLAWAAICFGGIILSIRNAYKARSGYRINPEARLKLIVAIACLICAICWAFLQITRNSYEAPIYLLLLLISLIFFNASAPEQKVGGFQLLSIRIIIPVISLSFASQLLLLAFYVPLLNQTLVSGGYIPSQPYSLSAFHYPELRLRILGVGRQCGINAQARPVRRLLVDDLTYFAYSDTYRPIHRIGLLGEWKGSIRDPLEVMRRNGSSGGVLGCQFLDHRLRAISKGDGTFCCIGAP